MKTLVSKANPSAILFSVLVLIAVVTIAPHAFAITFTAADNPHGPLAPLGWAAGFGVAGVMSGIGVLMAVKRRKLH